MGKSNNSIYVSKKHGLNPSMVCCPLCGKTISIALFGRINASDDEAPRHIVTGDLCDECRENLKNEGNIVVFEIKDKRMTGRYIKVPSESINPNINLNKRSAWMDTKDFKDIINRSVLIERSVTGSQNWLNHSSTESADANSSINAAESNRTV